MPTLSKRAASEKLPQQHHEQHAPPYRHSIGGMPSDDDRASLESMAAAILQRHSVAARPSFTAKDAPESILMRTSVRVAGVSTRDNFCEYVMEVDSGLDSRVLYKRYSEFRQFRAELLLTLKIKKSHCGHGPCSHLTQLEQVKFPRRRIRIPGFKSEGDIVVAKERAELLERFMQALLRIFRMTSRRNMRACMNSNCVMVEMIKNFLQVSEPVFSPSTTTDSEYSESSTSTSYLDQEPLAGPLMPWMPRCYPASAVWVATSQGDSKPGILFSIAEDGEQVVASE